MIRCLVLLLMLALLLTLAACAAAPTATEQETPHVEEPPAPPEPEPEPEPFPGKIAIVTNTPDGLEGNQYEYSSAINVVKKYGEYKIVHVMWPVDFMRNQEQMITIVEQLGQDPEIKALVINSAVPGTTAAVDKLLETRDDMFIVYCLPVENTVDIATSADLILQRDNFAMGPDMVKQAYKMGAKTFVHYSFPRHMGWEYHSTRRDLMRAECEKLGIEFADATVPDPNSDVGVTGMQQFVLDDVPKMIALYGKDTAFWGTNCHMQIPLIKAVSDQGGIYPQPCCPSPYHGYPRALEVEVPLNAIDDWFSYTEQVISETACVLNEKGVLGRFSTWPVSEWYLATNTGVEYVIKWLNSEVPQKGIDADVLKHLMEDYTGVECYLNAHEEDGVEYPNFLLYRSGYLTYGKEHILER